MIGIASVNDLQIIYYLMTLTFLAGFALYDIRHHKIRNTALLLFLPWCLLSIPIFQVANPLLPGSYAIIRSLLGFLSGGLLFLTAALISQNGLGGGDIKLMALIGIIFGTYGVITIALFSTLLALFAALPHHLFCRHKMLKLPFAPFILAGTLLYLLII